MKTYLFCLALLCGLSTAQTIPNTKDSSGVRFAGPGATPTIDAQVATCGSEPCVVVIDPQYAGPESTALMRTSTGYKVYKGSPKVTIIDYRSNSGTPENPAGVNLYPIIYGGRLAGQLTRLGVNYWVSGTVSDSTSAGAFFTWLSGTLPPEGDQFGLVSSIVTHDDLKIGSSRARIAAIDAEAIINTASADHDISDVRGVTAAVEITRAGATQGITNASAFHAGHCTNTSRSGATIKNCYGFEAEQNSAGETRNFGFYNHGDWLTDNDKKFYVVDSQGQLRQIAYFRKTDAIDYKPLSDTQGWNWKSQGDAGIFTIGNSAIISRVTHLFAADVKPNTDNVGSLGGSSNHWKGLYLSPCISDSSPASCESAVTGFVSIPATKTSVLVNTTAVSPHSTINVQFDESLGKALKVNCAATSVSEGARYFISERVPGVGFTIKTSVAPTTSPSCLSFTIIN